MIPSERDISFLTFDHTAANAQIGESKAKASSNYVGCKSAEKESTLWAVKQAGSGQQIMQGCQ